MVATVGFITPFLLGLVAALGCTPHLSWLSRLLGAPEAVVPYANLDRCYQACAAKKQRATYQTVPHIRSCGSDSRRYFGELDAFIRENSK